MNNFIRKCLHEPVDDIFWKRTIKFQTLLCALFIQPLGYNPFTLDYKYLRHVNIINLWFLILGVALVYKDFDAPLHKHKEDETYLFIFGRGKLHLNGKGVVWV